MGTSPWHDPPFWIVHVGYNSLNNPVETFVGCTGSRFRYHPFPPVPPLLSSAIFGRAHLELCQVTRIAKGVRGFLNVILKRLFARATEPLA